MTMFSNLKKNKTIISFFLSIVNTAVIVTALVIGINEFVIKGERSSAAKFENSFLLINELNSRGPLKHNYANYDFGSFSILDEITKEGKIGEDIDDILTIYQKISFCIEIDKCDKALILDKACGTAFLNDARIIYKTVVQEVERGGVFVDRIRVAAFFEFLKTCLSQDLIGGTLATEFSWKLIKTRLSSLESL